MFLKWSGLPAFITGSYGVALGFSLLVITMCLLAIVFPLKRSVTISFTFLYFLLAVIFNSYLCHGSHYLAGMVLLSVTFWPRKDENFDLLWEAMRYYACWIYGSAFLWKVGMGGFFQWDAGALTFKSNLAAYLYQNPGTQISHVYYFFIQHPFFLNIGHKIVTIIEGLMLIGFFTKRYDVLLIVLSLATFFSIYIFSDVFFIELQVTIFALLPERFWRWLSAKIPAFNKELRFSPSK
jgi:hypothetical protein